MSPGKLLYNLFYKPLAYVRQVVKAGVFNYYAIQSARREMERRSLLLKEITHDEGKPTLSVYFLTGEKYWYQTAFCLYSLQKFCENFNIQAILIDDGSFTDQLRSQIVDQFPSVRIVTAQQTESLLDTYLPKDKYPTIRQKRLNYPHLKKLTDVHFQPGNWKLVLDSDMLFFSYPQEFINWLQEPQTPFALWDPITSYHYSIALMNKLANKPVPEHINVGTIGLNSAEINWDAIEKWIAELETAEGSSYLLEQALSAMIVAGKTVQIAQPENYIVMPTKEQANSNTGILQHYVAASKQWYYKTAWRKI